MWILCGSVVSCDCHFWSHGFGFCWLVGWVVLFCLFDFPCVPGKLYLPWMPVMEGRKTKMKIGKDCKDISSERSLPQENR